MEAENISQEFRLKSIEETRNCFKKQLNINELVSKKIKSF